MTVWEAIDEVKARREGHPPRASNLAAQGILLGTDVGSGLAARSLMGKLMTTGHQIPLESASGLDVLRLAKMINMDVNTESTRGVMENAFYRPKILSDLAGKPSGRHGTVGAIGPWSKFMPADVAAHEIGHGLSWTGKAGPLAKLIAQIRLPGAAAATGGGLLGLFMGTTGHKPLADREKWLDRASIIGGAGMAPVLADEALASRNAMRVLRRVPENLLQKEVAKQAIRRLTRAWGTYGVSALGLVLGPQLAKRYYRSRE